MKSFFELNNIIKSIPFLTLPLHSHMTEKTSTKNYKQVIRVVQENPNNKKNNYYLTTKIKYLRTYFYTRYL